MVGNIGGVSMEQGMSGSLFDSNLETDSGVFMPHVLGVTGGSREEVGSCLDFVQSSSRAVLLLLLLESSGKDGKLPSCCCDR